MIRDAILSLCSVYRYTLVRSWNSDGPRLLFIMLNPSTADAKIDDATIKRCVRFAVDMGYGSIEVVNLFAFRATDPSVLTARGYPVGPENDRHIIEALGRAGAVICAWGAVRHPRIADVLATINLFSASPPMALAFTKSGQPRHPLYLSADCRPQPLRAECTA